MEGFVNCKGCGRRFNLDNREPIVLFCCGATACSECAQKMNTNNNSDASHTSNPEVIFNCIFCKSEKFKGSKVNSYARDYIAKNLTTKVLMITCDCQP